MKRSRNPTQGDRGNFRRAPVLFTAVGALLVGYVVWICVKMAMHAFVGGTALICVAAIGAAGLMVAIAAMTARRA